MLKSLSADASPHTCAVHLRLSCLDALVLYYELAAELAEPI